MAFVAFHVLASVGPALFTIRNDFANYYLPARAVVEGRRLDGVYDRDWLATEAAAAGVREPASFVPQPPLNALLLVPLAWLTPQAAKAVWTLILVGAFGATFLLLRSITALSPGMAALALLVPVGAVRNALLFGQPYPLLLMFFCLSLRDLERGRLLRAGLWLAPALVLKLYGLPIVLWLAATRRFRPLAGLAMGTGALLLVEGAVLGGSVHRWYAREVLPASLQGRVQDPYAVTFQSPSTVAHRLFQYEVDLNPEPVADRPSLARGLARGMAVAIVLLTVAALVRSPGPRPERRAYGALLLAALAASPMPASYHFILLSLPAAAIIAERPRHAPLVLVATAFAGSLLPHLAAPLARGWMNVLAAPRLVVVLGLLVAAVASRPSWRAVLATVAVSTAAGVAAPSMGAEPPWSRVGEARGYVAAEPRLCGGELTWIAAEERQLRRRSRSGPVDPVACARPVPEGAPTDVAAAWILGDVDTLAQGGWVFAGSDGAVRERTPAGERVLYGDGRHPRVSPDGRRVLGQAWRGSWDLVVVDRASGALRALTHDPQHEVEPAWLDDGRIVFASDRRRGLEFTALYTMTID